MLKIGRQEFQIMLDHLREVYPLEGCGLMAGRDGMVQRLYTIPNRLASPVVFEMDPKIQLEAMLEMEEHELELLAIFHSHPHGPNTPSPRDINLAHYPESIQIIVSLAQPRLPVVRAFTIAEGQVNEVAFQIV